MTKVSEILKNRIKELNVSPAEIAKVCDVNVSTVYKWTTGEIEEIGSTKIAALAKMLKISPSVIVGDLDDEEAEQYLPLSQGRRIPVYSEICCGKGLFAEESITGYLSLPISSLPNKSADYFAMTANGDSMNDAGIHTGDTLIFRKTDNVENGKIGCFVINDEKAVCKRFNKVNDTIVLTSANDKYPPTVITKDAASDFRIIGLLVMQISVR
jgi:repressor LexA